MGQKEYTIDDLEAALIDVLDVTGNWYEIEEQTGLSIDRCKEIETLLVNVNKNYKERHGIE